VLIILKHVFKHNFFISRHSDHSSDFGTDRLKTAKALSKIFRKKKQTPKVDLMNTSTLNNPIPNSSSSLSIENLDDTLFDINLLSENETKSNLTDLLPTLKRVDTDNTFYGTPSSEKNSFLN
jgi:hypothetical protein